MAHQFERDPAKAAANLLKHGVSFEEALTVFADSRSMHKPDPEHSTHEQRYLLLGHSNEQRILVVAYTQRAPRTRIISARPADRQERETYAKG